MNKTVLIIENDPDHMELLETIVSGLELDAVCVGEAIDVTTVNQIDPALILLDHWLDESLGADFCKELKASPLTSHIPVVMLSASITMAHTALEAGASKFIPKPFDLQELSATILKLL